MTQNTLLDAIEQSASDFEDQMQAQAEEQNKRNAACAVDCGTGQQEFLTPDQVRSMSRREVRDQYELIIESMKHWH